MDYIGELRQLIGTRPIIMVGANVILINEQGEILMHHRRDRDCWGLPGGAMELGESLEENARREVFEEVGLTCGALELFNVYSGAGLYHKYPDGNEVYNVTATYLCREYSGDLQVDMIEGRDAKFFSIDRIPENLSMPITGIIQEYIGHAKKQTANNPVVQKALIETERLELRPFHNEDLDLIYEINNHPECIKFNGWDSMDRDACHEVLTKWQEKQRALKTSGPLCVVEKETKQPIGMAFIVPWEEGQKAYEIGFRLKYDKWHLGYGQEMTRAFLGHAQQTLKASTVVAEVSSENERSLNVFRKAGFAEEPHPGGEGGKLFRYVLNHVSC